MRSDVSSKWVAVRLLMLIIAITVIGINTIVSTAPSAFAQSGTPAAPLTTPNSASSASVESVAKDLFCPLCKGVRLNNCDLTACEQMRQVIGQKLVSGESTAQIRADFVQQYGDVVLGEPPLSGFNLLAWLLPGLLLVGGAIWIATVARGWVTHAAPTGSATTPTPISAEYASRIEKDLEHYDG